MLGLLHVVHEDDVGGDALQRAGDRHAAVDEAGDLEARGLAQGEPDPVDDQRVVGDDEQALHGNLTRSAAGPQGSSGRCAAFFEALTFPALDFVLPMALRVTPRRSTTGTAAATALWSTLVCAVTMTATSAPAIASSSGRLARPSFGSSATCGSW